jgi:hypothetical protein
MDDDKTIYANAFGVNDFPVCSEQDKEAIERGFKHALAWADSPEGKAYDSSMSNNCTCSLVARLLNGEATYGDMMIIGNMMARDIYVAKKGTVAILELITGIAGRLEQSQMFRDPVMGAAPKKEWVN